MLTNLETQLLEIREGLLDLIDSNVSSPITSLSDYRLSVKLLKETDFILKTIRNKKSKKYKYNE